MRKDLLDIAKVNIRLTALVGWMEIGIRMEMSGYEKDYRDDEKGSQRFLIKQLVSRDFRTKYKRSALCIA